MPPPDPPPLHHAVIAVWVVAQHCRRIALELLDCDRKRPRGVHHPARRPPDAPDLHHTPLAEGPIQPDEVAVWPGELLQRDGLLFAVLVEIRDLER